MVSIPLALAPDVMLEILKTMHLNDVFVCSMECLQRKMKNILWNPFGTWRETSQLLGIIILCTRGLRLIEPIKIAIVGVSGKFWIITCTNLIHEYARPWLNSLASCVQRLNVNVKVNGVFPKWISLNSVNHDKIQKWYGYQRYYLTSNSYITNGSKRKCKSITTCG